ncbi:Glucose-6-phosphate exchanger SLC37A2 [Portunus trituberculatus]|uniref:Glucose-6-phosphate exchanger SLC37A2 n=1 Tax=Portunus trituberculatus TaxID=210409 RepID=A0A5B7E1P3_PORTR|nr:Glucose-6-phosphate exchanger SLC37A2 [Portunus trituberculatus]
MGYSSWIWILTFLIYCSYHMSRKPISVVKNVLYQNCTLVNETRNGTYWCDWKPFDNENAPTLLSTVDSSFLFTYAFVMFFSGFVAERMDLRLFLSGGMVFSGVFCSMFGLGLIMGIWNSHTSVGNILGTVIPAAFVSYNWGLSFIVPGLIIASVGVLVFFFMVPEPTMVGLPNPNKKEISHDVMTKMAGRIHKQHFTARVLSCLIGLRSEMVGGQRGGLVAIVSTKNGRIWLSLSSGEDAQISHDVMAGHAIAGI